VLTGPDDSHDLMKWAAALVFVTGVGLTVYTVVVERAPFSLREFGEGAGVLMVALGTAIRIKAPAEIPVLTEVTQQGQP
jgi:hypothetical protein